jgi:hypothetical protein
MFQLLQLAVEVGQLLIEVAVALSAADGLPQLRDVAGGGQFGQLPFEAPVLVLQSSEVVLSQTLFLHEGAAIGRQGLDAVPLDLGQPKLIGSVQVRFPSQVPENRSCLLLRALQLRDQARAIFGRFLVAAQLGVQTGDRRTMLQQTAGDRLGGDVAPESFDLPQRRLLVLPGVIQLGGGLAALLRKVVGQLRRVGHLGQLVQQLLAAADLGKCLNDALQVALSLPLAPQLNVEFLLARFVVPQPLVHSHPFGRR